MRTHPIVEYYQALRDSAPCLSRAATLPKGTKLGLGKRRAPGNTIILSQPYRRGVSTDRLNREGSQLAASLEGEPGPTPAGKTLPHSFPETSRFRRERARDVEKKYSLDQPEENILNKEHKRRFQAITFSVMCLGQVTRYDIRYAVNQLARAMCKPSKAHMAAAKHLLRYLAGTTNFAITYKRGGLKLTVFSDANWSNNPDKGKSTSSYIAFLSDGLVSFKVGSQGLTAQSTMEAELVAAALTMKETVFCSNMMKKLGFGMRFDNVPVYIDNTSTLSRRRQPDL